jgi:dynein regulatory complex protein 1
VLLLAKVPQELFKDIEAQKKRCTAVLASKDALISEFSLQLKVKDEEYVTILKKHSEDVEELLARMRREFKELSDEYEVELESIEDAFLAERAELLKTNKEVVDSMFDRRKQAEVDYLTTKQVREQRHFKEIEDLIVHDHEEHSKLKIKLETDIEILEQQLEEMQATYQLNTEKLEYNYRVLTERDNENSQTLQQLKRKQMKLKETLLTLVTRHHETETKDRKRNDELTEGYRAITKQYKDLQIKFRHFEVADNKRFDELWAMHEEEITSCIRKVLQADELITTQQLGMEWKRPDLSGLRFMGNPSTVSVPEIPNSGLNVDLAVRDTGHMIPVEKMRAMLQLLVDEAHFLVDSKVTSSLSELSGEEGSLIQAESMLRALGVDDEADVQSLVHFFFPLLPDADEAKSDVVEDEPEALQSLKRLIRPDDVVGAIGAFVNTRKASKCPGANPPIVTGSDITSAPLMRRNGRREEKDYWLRASGIVSDETFSVWAQLEKALIQYNTILSERSDAINEVEALRHKNASLRALLNTYLGARVNEELVIPPQQTMRIGHQGF